MAEAAGRAVTPRMCCVQISGLSYVPNSMLYVLTQRQRTVRMR